MTVRIHHLNCATLRPIGAPPMVCHVLLLETDGGLVLVDTGLGLADIEAPSDRLGAGLPPLIRPDFDPAETAAAQVAALGFDRADVTHIVATHLDSDHTGGIDDFPGAVVHATGAELRSASTARGVPAAVRYRPWRRSPEPAVASYDRFEEDWFGFASTRLDAIDDDVLLVPLPGHTPGHAGVAVRTGDTWLLHCGDAFYHRAAVFGGSIPLTVRAFQYASAMRRGQAKDTRRRIAGAVERFGSSVRVVCAHDPVMYQRCLSGTI